MGKGKQCFMAVNTWSFLRQTAAPGNPFPASDLCLSGLAETLPISGQRRETAIIKNRPVTIKSHVTLLRRGERTRLACRSPRPRGELRSLRPWQGSRCPAAPNDGPRRGTGGSAMERWTGPNSCDRPARTQRPEQPSLAPSGEPTVHHQEPTRSQRHRPGHQAERGKRHVHRRYRCPLFLRQSFHEYAKESVLPSRWAAAYYLQQRTKGAPHNTAVRALAFKWQRILWRCW